MITKEEQQRRLTIVRDGYVAMPEAKFAAHPSFWRTIL